MEHLVACPEFMQGEIGRQQHRLVALSCDGSERIVDADSHFVAADWLKQTVLNILDGHCRVWETKNAILVKYAGGLQRLGVVVRQARKQQAYVLCLGETVQLSQREMRRSVEPIDIGKSEDDVDDLLRARAHASANSLEKSDRRPEEDESLDLEDDDAPPGLAQDTVRAQRAFDVTAIVAPRELGLDDIKLAVFDQEVGDSDENSNAHSRQKSGQRDDRSDDQDEDVVTEKKATTSADQPFVHQTEREQDQQRAHHDL